VVRERHLRVILRLIELLVDQGDGLDAPPALLEAAAVVDVIDLADLQLDQAGDDLEVVLDAMVDLLEEHVAFLERRGELRGPIPPAVLELGIQRAELGEEILALLLGKLALREIDVDAGRAERLAGVVAEDLPAPGDPADRAVGPYDPPLGLADHVGLERELDG